MTRAKGSSFNLGDQGIFTNFLDYNPTARTDTNLVNRNALTALLATLTDGGVVVVPHGVAIDTNYSWPVTSEDLCVVFLQGQRVSFAFNKASATFDQGAESSALTVALIEADTVAYTDSTISDQVVSDTSIIPAASNDLVRYLGSVPIEATQRAGGTPGRKYLQRGLALTGAFAQVGAAEIFVLATTETATCAAATQFCILNHTATIAAGTVVFPSSPANGQTFKLWSRSIVTALTLSSGTDTIPTGHGITTIAAAARAEWIYQSSDTSWYRVG